MTAYEESENETFPFVTLPNFEVAASHARAQSGVETVNFLPLVEGSQKQLWEAYSVAKFDEWMEESKVGSILSFPASLKIINICFSMFSIFPESSHFIGGDYFASN